MMKSLMSIALMAALSGAAMAALAQAPTPTQQPAAKQVAPAIASTKEEQSQLVELQAMDANRDGLVSRLEYMSHYEGLYGKIKKDGAGMISLKDFASGTPIAAAR